MSPSRIVYIILPRRRSTQRGMCLDENTRAEKPSREVVTHGPAVKPKRTGKSQRERVALARDTVQSESRDVIPEREMVAHRGLEGRGMWRRRERVRTVVERPGEEKEMPCRASQEMRWMRRM